MLRKIFFILSLITFSLSTATAAVYKWVDEKGNVHYTEQRPTESESEKVRINKAPPPSNSSYKKPSLKTKDDEKTNGDDKANTDSKAGSKNEASAKEKQDMCDNARKDLALMEGSGRLRVKDKDGNVTYMPDEDKEARIKRNQDRIKQYCK